MADSPPMEYWVIDLGSTVVWCDEDMARAAFDSASMRVTVTDLYGSTVVIRREKIQAIWNSTPATRRLSAEHTDALDDEDAGDEPEWMP